MILEICQFLTTMLEQEVGTGSLYDTLQVQLIQRNVPYPAPTYPFVSIDPQEFQPLQLEVGGLAGQWRYAFDIVGVVVQSDRDQGLIDCEIVCKRTVLALNAHPGLDGVSDDTGEQAYKSELGRCAIGQGQVQDQKLGQWAYAFLIELAVETDKP